MLPLPLAGSKNPARAKVNHRVIRRVSGKGFLDGGGSTMGHEKRWSKGITVCMKEIKKERERKERQLFKKGNDIFMCYTFWLTMSE